MPVWVRLLWERHPGAILYSRLEAAPTGEALPLANPYPSVIHRLLDSSCGPNAFGFANRIDHVLRLFTRRLE